MKTSKKNALRIGLFGIGLDTYWPQFAGLEQRLKGYLGKVATKLNRPGVQVVNLGLVDTQEKAMAAGHQFREADVDLIFLHVTTYALFSTVLPVVRRAKVPVIILNLQPEAAIDYAVFNRMGDRTKMTGEWLAYCAACPVPEIANVFNRCRIPFHQVTGMLDNDPACWREVDEWVEAARVAHTMEHNRMGVMGHYYCGMLDIYSDLTQQCAFFGGHVEIVEVDELAALRTQVTKGQIADRVKHFNKVFDVQPDCAKAELERAACTSVALDIQENAATAMIAAGDVLYIGGQFTRNSSFPIFLVSVDANTGQVKQWQARAASPVTALALSGSHLLAGEFYLGSSLSLQRGSFDQPMLAALDARTGKPLNWNPELGVGGVEDLVTDGKVVYLSGSLDSRPPRLLNGLAAVDITTGAVVPWRPQREMIFGGKKGDVSFGAIALSGGNIYAQGLLFSPPNNEFYVVVSLDAETGVTNWVQHTDGGFLNLEVSSGTVYVGGSFTSVGGLKRNHLAALDAATGAVTDWNPNSLGGIFSLAVDGPTIYVGGDVGGMIKIGGERRNYLAAVDAVTGKATPFNPPADGRVAALAIFGGVLYVGGDFSRIGGQSRSGLAAIDLSTGLPTDWNPSPNRPGFIDRFSISVSERAVYVTGGFTEIGGKYRPKFAVFPLIGSPEIVRQPEHQQVAAGLSVRFGLQVNGEEPRYYQWSSNGTNIGGATNATLTVSKTQTTDSGEYSVVVSNPLGLINSRPARLIVVQPASIVAQPASQAVQPGANVTLSVQATGNPPPNYQWRLNGVNIPGAVFPTLTLADVQAADSGAYSVAVSNVGGAVNSDAVELTVRTPPLPMADNFSDRVLFNQSSNIGHGGNAGATHEAGEPRHAGKAGGPSVWLSWIAPNDGVAVFQTRGSAFDTVLAVYTGNGLGSLTEVASDDDSGGYLTSLVSFNASRGTEYQIVIDGFFGATGNFILNWTLETSGDGLPRILVQPRSQTVGLGEDVTLSVVASPASVTYQWFFNCLQVTGATNATLNVRNVGSGQVGLYSVQINTATRGVESDRATLQVNFTAGRVVKTAAQDKLADVLEPPAGAALQRVSFGEANDGVPGGVGLQGVALASDDLRRVGRHFVSVAQGTTGLQLFNTFAATKEPGEPNHCGVAGGASYWFAIKVESEGLLTVSTEGSDFDTVLAVYRWGGTILDALQEVACDDNSGRDGADSIVHFGAQAGAVYYIAVDGVNAATGTVRLSYALDNEQPVLRAKQFL